MAIEHTNWDNLRLFLAVVRAQSAQEAARRLEVDHSTITRRLHRLEKELGAQLLPTVPQPGAPSRLLASWPAGGRQVRGASRQQPERGLQPSLR